MRYFKFSYGLDSYPQVKGFGDTIFISDPNHLWHFNEKYVTVDFSQSPPQQGPNLDFLLLNPRLKKGPADILSQYIGLVRGFLISERTKTLLDNFTLSPHKFYPCRVSLREKYWDYYYLYFYGHLGNLINFSESPVLITNLIGDTILDKIIFNNLEEYKAYYLKKNLDFGFKFEKIIFGSSLKPFDFFGCFITMYRPIYVSELLKDAMNSSAITNVDFSSLPDNYISFQ